MMSDKIEPVGAMERQSGLARLLLSLYLADPGSLSWISENRTLCKYEKQVCGVVARYSQIL